MSVINYYTVNGTIIGERTGTGGFRAYGRDALGSVTSTFDSAGSLENTYRYKPYGGQIAKTGTAIDPVFKWVGSLGYRSVGASWSEIYVRRRVVSTSTARWTTVDPLWPREMLYSYCTSAPVTCRDSAGLQSLCQDVLQGIINTGQPMRLPLPEIFPVPPAWPGTWPAGNPGEPCWHPSPGHFRPVGSGSACNRYYNACLRGSVLACNMYYVCMGAGWQGGISLPPISGPGADCVRGCLLSVLGGQTLSSCRCAYAQHQECFNICGWSPPWMFNWATWSFVCVHHTAGAPEPGHPVWTTP